MIELLKDEPYWGDLIFRSQQNTVKAAVEEAVEKGICLHFVNLFGADLAGINLSGVFIENVGLSKANLSGANLMGAKLPAADLTWSDLTHVNLSGSDLEWANLFGADLEAADLSGANLDWTEFHSANLKDIIAMDVKKFPIEHHGGTLDELKLVQILPAGPAHFPKQLC